MVSVVDAAACFGDSGGWARGMPKEVAKAVGLTIAWVPVSREAAVKMEHTALKAVIRLTLAMMFNW